MKLWIVMGARFLVRWEYASNRDAVKSTTPHRLASTCDDGDMSGFGGVWPRILDGAIEAARKVLREMEGTEVPAGVQRVAAYQGGKLPPPLAARLLRELDENDWFRATVAAQLEDGSSGPSTRFLLRPPGWWLELADLVTKAEDESGQAGLATLERKLAAAEAKRTEAVKRLKDGRREAAEAAREARRLAEEAREATEGRFAAEIAELEAVRTDLRDATRRIGELERERRELLDAYGMLRSRRARIRRGGEARGHGGGTGGSPPRDPVALARMLDLQSAEFGRHRARPRAAPTPKSGPTIATGVRPDSADAIDWLLRIESPVTVLVDGYNAQFYIDRDDFISGAARRNLFGLIERLRRSSRVPHRFVIVYDSALPGGRDPRTSVGGVEVRFAEEDRIADDELIELAAELDRVVVVTSDREVREGAEEEGAVVLWSEALEAWARRR
jgi:predicted RNA-binding protein with PIN domain